jgi:hypothetical protein
MSVCDGCGAHVDEAHIRRRIERLELATRFRPIHIHVLFLDAAPPSRIEDYFYRPSAHPDDRSAPSRLFFDEVIKCTGQHSVDPHHEESTLAEFQKRGFFLAYAVECPIENPGSLAATINKLAPSILLRVKFSYKPKWLAPISSALGELIPRFEGEGWTSRLILNGSKPFDSARSACAHIRATMVSALSEQSHP